MRTVLLAPPAARDRLHAELVEAGLQVLSETPDPATALVMMQALQPELVVAACPENAEAWAREAGRVAPTAYLCLIGPAIASDNLLALMRAGVREYLPDVDAPLADTLARCRQALRPAPAPVTAAKDAGTGRTVVVFSPKGGVGKSTLAANLAVALYQATQTQTRLVDLALQFGDQDLLLNLQPQKTICDLVPVSHDLDARILDQLMTPSPIGVRLLASPLRPEDGEAVGASQVERAFEVFKATPGWTVIDCAAQLDDVSVRAIELADLVLMPVTLDLAAVRRVVRAQDVFRTLDVDMAKVQTVVWNNTRAEITASDVAQALGRPVGHQLPWAPEAVAASINQGIPLMIGQPTSPLAVAITGMAGILTGQKAAKAAKEGGFGHLFNKAFSWMRKKEDVKLLTAGSGG